MTHWLNDKLFFFFLSVLFLLWTCEKGTRKNGEKYFHTAVK